MSRDEALRACLDLLGAPKYSGADEMPPGAELDLDERARRLFAPRADVEAATVLDGQLSEYGTVLPL
jgi:hypothetical protein